MFHFVAKLVANGFVALSELETRKELPLETMPTIALPVIMWRRPQMQIITNVHAFLHMPAFPTFTPFLCWKEKEIK